jgi:hypothetical protein
VCPPDRTGTDNPAEILMINDRTVTATFVEGKYRLVVDPGDWGTVEIEPLKPEGYDYGDQVILTPVPQAGWLFAGWEGASGSDPVERGDGTWLLTVDGHEELTATWERAEYALNTYVVEGAGQILIDPLKPSYGYGDQVWLTAVPQLGFAFRGWGGDISGTENPTSLTITGDATVTASFAAGPVRYYFVPIVYLSR